MATMEVAEEYLLHKHSGDELCVIFMATHDVSSSSGALYQCISIAECGCGKVFPNTQQ